MKVILTEDIKTLGKRGAIVNVSDGYAKNFLFPKKSALLATDATIANEKERVKIETVKYAKILGKAQELATTLEGKSVSIKMKAGNEGKLYGTVTAKEISTAVKEQLGYDVDRRKIHVDSAIKLLGQHPVSFKLHPEVNVTVNVDVQSVG